MATIEERLKQYIKDNYSSVRAFVLAKDLNYANVDSILRRGIKNATWNSVKSLCEALEISADELAEDRIVPVPKDNDAVKAEDVLAETINKILYTENLTIADEPASIDDRMAIAASMEMLLATRKRLNEYAKELVKDDKK